MADMHSADMHSGKRKFVDSGVGNNSEKNSPENKQPYSGDPPWDRLPSTWILMIVRKLT